MATRAGSIDPGLVLWLLQQGELDVDEVALGLEHDGGLAGLTGGSGDMRDVVAGVARGEPEPCLAFAVYVHRLRREIAAMVAALEGLDCLVFTGGIGEHQPAVRAAAAEGLGFLGLAIEPIRNAATSGDCEISRPDATARTIVVSSREDLEIFQPGAVGGEHCLGVDAFPLLGFGLRAASSHGSPCKWNHIRRATTRSPPTLVEARMGSASTKQR